MRDRPGLRQELAQKQRDADRDQDAPRHVRPAQEQARQRGNGKAHRRHQRRRQFVEREPRGDEARPPDHRDQHGKKDIRGLHRLA
jgi:hypothetical protein